ncbi:hypothetical protein SRABI70_03782 [Pseudomonas sp. Bi70]|nr:hypothetical protein SRABI70_03782 [Pseudomonas sp. Bi70]
MGQAAGQLADGFHFLRLAQRLLGHVLRRDVAADEVEYLPGGIRGGGPQEVTRFTALAAQAAGEATDLFALAEALHEVQYIGPVIFDHQVEERGLQQVLAIPAQQLRPGRVDGLEKAVESGRAHQVVGAFPQAIALGGAFAQFGTVELFTGDVARRAVGLAAIGHGHPGQPAPLAVLAAEAMLQAQCRLAGLLEVQPHVLGARLVLGVHEVEKVGAGQLFLGPAEGHLPGRVGGFEVAVVVEHAEQIRGDLPGAATLEGLGDDLLFEFGVERHDPRNGAVAFPFDGAPLLDVDQYAGKAQASAIGGQFDAAVGLQPIVVAIGAAHAVLVGIGAAPGNRFVDGGVQAVDILGVHRRHHLLQAEASAAQGRVEAEAAGEGFVDGELVTGQIPEPGADDRTSGQRQLHPFGIGEGRLFDGDHLGGFDGHIEKTGDRPAGVAQRAVGEGPVGVFGVAIAGGQQVHVLLVHGCARQYLVDQRADGWPDVGPDFFDGAPQCIGVAFTEQCDVGIVVDQGSFRPPGRAHGETAGAHDGAGGAQLCRPALLRAQRSSGPVEIVEDGRHGKPCWWCGQAASVPSADLGYTAPSAPIVSDHE